MPSFVLGTLGLTGLGLLLAVPSVARAWTALLRLEGSLFTDKVSLAMLPEAFLRCAPGAIRLGALQILPLLIVLWTLPRLARPTVPLWVWIIVAGGLLAAAILFALCLYAFPLLALRDVDLPTALRHSLYLSSRHLANTVGLFSMAILAGFGIAYVSLGLLLVLPPLYGMFVVNDTRLVLTIEAID